jgi:hypothetical protein
MQPAGPINVRASGTQGTCAHHVPWASPQGGSQTHEAEKWWIEVGTCVAAVPQSMGAHCSRCIMVEHCDAPSKRQYSAVRPHPAVASDIKAECFAHRGRTTQSPATGKGLNSEGRQEQMMLGTNRARRWARWAGAATPQAPKPGCVRRETPGITYRPAGAAQSPTATHTAGGRAEVACG